MPTILTPQGWVKVAESPTKRRTIAVDPADALKGPLAYFSCKRSPPKVYPGVLQLPTGVTGGGKRSTSREAFPYDLNASPEKLRAQGRGLHSSQVEKVKIGGKNRTVSAPVPEMHIEENDPYYSEKEQHRSRHGHSPPSSPSPVAASHSSRHHESKHSKHHHHKHRSHRHHDDVSSVSSGSTSSSSSSSSYRSHHSHERARPIQAAPQPPIIMYTTAPPLPAPSGPRYYNYESPRHAHPPPPSTGSARSMSYSWYNATTPLNL
jgi:hypothetical protein